MNLKRLFSISLLSMMILYALVPGGVVAAASPAQPVMNQYTVLQVTKTADADTVTAGEPIGFIITINNTGQNIAYQVSLQDQLSSQTTWSTNRSECTISAGGLLNCDFGSLAVQGSTQVHVTATSRAAMCGTLYNTATATAPNTSKAVSNQASITINCVPDVTISKTAGAAQVRQGQPVSFTMTVRNHGTAAANDVQLIDPLPELAGLGWSIETPVTGCSISGGSLTCNFGSLDPGETRSVTVTSPTTTEGCGVIENTATVSASNEPKANQDDNSATAKTQICCPTATLRITKTADDGTVTPPDETIGYTITVTNTGSGPANNVVITDSLATGFVWTETTGADCHMSGQTISCNMGTLAAGASASIHLTAPTSIDVCGDYTNVAYASADNAARVQSQVVSVTVDCPQPVNVQVTKRAQSSTVTAGTTAAFIITVTNAGIDPAQNVVVTDILPVIPGMRWSIASPAPSACNITGGTLTCTYLQLAGRASQSVTITSPTTTQSCQVVNNTATVTADNEGDNTADNTSTTSLNVQCPGLVVTKTADAPSVIAPNPIGYTITLANTGQVTLTGVVLDDDLNGALTWTETTGANCTFTGATVQNVPVQHLTCNMGDLAPNGEVSVHVTAPTNDTICNSTIYNIAYAEAANSGQVQSDQVQVNIGCPVIVGVNVKVSKTANKPLVYPGGTLVFTMVVTSDGTQTATGVTLHDPLPDATNLSWSLVQPVTGCSIASGALDCSFATLDPGESRTVAVSTFAKMITESQTVTNTVTVSAVNETGPTTDNTATASSVLTCEMLKYFNDFEGSFPGDFGISDYKRTVAPKGQAFLGDYGNQSITLSLGCLPAGHTQMVIDFDLYILRSWDGNNTAHGPDHFKVEIDGGPVLLDTTFSNWNRSDSPQSYPDNFPDGNYPGKTGAVADATLGYTFGSYKQDTIYHLSFRFPHTGDTVVLRFTGSGLQALTDESWGVDNLTLATGGPYGAYLPFLPFDGSTTVVIPIIISESRTRQSLSR